MSADADAMLTANGDDDEHDDGERRYKSRTRLLSLDDLDRRTRAFQVAADAKHAIISDLGGEDQLSTLELIQAENAAIDAAILRDLQVRWLHGEGVEAAVLATLENTFNRTAAALGTKRRTRELTPNLDQYTAQRSLNAAAADGLADHPAEDRSS
jgi:hypothetical protein